jgi:hypothetical protein
MYYVGSICYLNYTDIHSPVVCQNTFGSLTRKSFTFGTLCWFWQRVPCFCSSLLCYCCQMVPNFLFCYVVLILGDCTGHSFPEMCYYRETEPGILTSDISGCTRYPVLALTALTALTTCSFLIYFVGVGSLHLTLISSFPGLRWCY